MELKSHKKRQQINYVLGFGKKKNIYFSQFGGLNFTFNAMYVQFMREFVNWDRKYDYFFLFLDEYYFLFFQTTEIE